MSLRTFKFDILKQDFYKSRRNTFMNEPIWAEALASELIMHIRSKVSNMFFICDKTV